MTTLRSLLLMVGILSLVVSTTKVVAKAQGIEYGKSVFPVDRDLAAKVRMRYGSETGDPALILSGNYLTASPEAVAQRDLFEKPYYYADFSQPYSSYYGGYYGNGPPPTAYGYGNPYNSIYSENYTFGFPFFGFPFFGSYTEPYPYNGYRQPFHDRRNRRPNHRPDHRPDQRRHRGRMHW